MTDWRGLCEELVEIMKICPPPYRAQDEAVFMGVFFRARAALAQPEPEVGPTDEELLGLDELEESWNAQADAANTWDELGIDEIIVWAQRQALARYGHQPAPPAEGEVAELVADLRECAASCVLASKLYWAEPMRRAADLLEQRHPTPVPVSERLPGPGDCDAEGRCWWLVSQDGTSDWLRRSARIRLTAANLESFGITHWLPATALPLPSGEVK